MNNARGRQKHPSIVPLPLVGHNPHLRDAISKQETICSGSATADKKVNGIIRYGHKEMVDQDRND